MATAVQKITLSSSRDVPFNKLVLYQSNVRRVRAGVSVEEMAESIARRGLIQSLHVRPVLDDDGAETGMFEVPAGEASSACSIACCCSGRADSPTSMADISIARNTAITINRAPTAMAPNASHRLSPVTAASVTPTSVYFGR